MNNAFDDVFDAAGRKYNVDPRLAKTVFHLESSGNPGTRDSYQGAQGGMQMLPATARAMGASDPRDMGQAIDAATRYLREGLDKTGSPEGALAYYHAGPDTSGWGPKTAAYVAKGRDLYPTMEVSTAMASKSDAKPSDSDEAAGRDFVKSLLSGKTAPKQADAAIDPDVAAGQAFVQQLAAPAAAPVPTTAADMPAAPDAQTVAQPGVNIPGVSGPPPGFDFGEIARAAGDGYNGGALVTPAGVSAADSAGLGWLARGANMLSKPVAAGMNAGQDILYQIGNSVAPGLGRDVVGASIALPMVAHGMVPEAGGNALARDAGAPVNRMAAAPDAARPIAPAPSAAGAGEPIPQSVGAAASRDTSNPSFIPPETPAQRATSMQKMVTQSAEDRLSPGGRDDAVYVPGVVRPEAMRDFSPAKDGEMSTALQHKTLYNTDSNYHDQFDAQVKRNNQVMVDNLHDMFGDANSREAAMNDAKKLMPGSIDLFKDEQPTSAQPIVDKIKEIIASPAGKRDAVASQLSKILPKLYNADGELESLPSQLKGIRDDITDKLYDKSPTVEGNAARTAASQLRDVLGTIDDTIGKGLPGTKYADYLSNLSSALGQVSKQDYLQQYMTGSKKLTDLAGNLQFNKVQKMLEDIQKHHADVTGGAKELSPDEISRIEAVRNELAAKDLLDRRASVRGSPTAQLQASSGILGNGPLGAAVRSAGELGLHGILAATTGGTGNALLSAAKMVAKPAMRAAADQKQAAAAAAMKNRLLDTTPNPLQQ